MWNNFNSYPRMPYQQQMNNYAYNSSNSQSPYPASAQQQSLNYQQAPMQQAQNNLIWVRGKENARSMQLQPNSTIIMLDNQANKFYIKTTDDIGLGRLRVFSYSEEEDNNNTSSSETAVIENIDLSNYVTKEELEKIISTLKSKEEKEEAHEQPISTTQSSTKQFKQQF